MKYHYIILSRIDQHIIHNSKEENIIHENSVNRYGFDTPGDALVYAQIRLEQFQHSRLEYPEQYYIKIVDNDLIEVE